MKTKLCICGLWLVAGRLLAWDVAYNLTITNAGSVNIVITSIQGNFFQNGVPYQWNVWSGSVTIPGGGNYNFTGDDPWPPGTDANPSPCSFFNVYTGTTQNIGTTSFNGSQTITLAGGMAVGTPASSGSGGSANTLGSYSETNPLPVLIIQDLQSGQVDYWNCVAAGMATGFMFFGFGMIFRMAKKVGSNYD